MVLAVVLAVGAVAWIASGNMQAIMALLTGSTEMADAADTPAGAGSASAPLTPGTGAAPVEREPTTVRYYESAAREHASFLRLAGRTEPSRSGRISAEVDGAIVELLVENGQRVEQGALLARIEATQRQAAVSEAQALVKQREIEFDAASRLAQKGFQSEVRRAEAASQLEAARAALTQARFDLSKTRITAPFDGIVMGKAVELGDYVGTGDPIAGIVDLDPLLIVADVSEREVLSLEQGSLARARLIDGTEVEGVISYIAPEADAVTRTFEIEIEVSDVDNRIKAGVTTEVFLPMRRMRAHLISPALLTLGDEGSVGVKLVNGSDEVRFVPVDILEDSAKGLWVAGLPERARLISVGQEFVVEGERVQAVPDTAFVPELPDAAGPAVD